MGPPSPPLLPAELPRARECGAHIVTKFGNVRARCRMGVGDHAGTQPVL